MATKAPDLPAEKPSGAESDKVKASEPASDDPPKAVESDDVKLSAPGKDLKRAGNEMQADDKSVTSSAGAKKNSDKSTVNVSKSAPKVAPKKASGAQGDNVKRSEPAKNLKQTNSDNKTEAGSKSAKSSANGNKNGDKGKSVLKGAPKKLSDVPKQSEPAEEAKPTNTGNETQAEDKSVKPSAGGKKNGNNGKSAVNKSAPEVASKEVSSVQSKNAEGSEPAKDSMQTNRGNEMQVDDQSVKASAGGKESNGEITVSENTENREDQGKNSREEKATAESDGVAGDALVEISDEEVHDEESNKDVQIREERDSISDTENLSDEVVNVEEGNEIEEEDVPEDFFEDLMSEEFMDGLNVVDAWDEEELMKDGIVTKREHKAKGRKSPVRYPASLNRRQLKALELRTKRAKEKELLQAKEKELRDLIKTKERELLELTDPSRRPSRDRRSPRDRQSLRERRVPREVIGSRERRLAREKRHAERLSRERRSRSAERKRSRSKSKETRQSKEDKDETDVRRDPSKTKRDIQKDKDRCAKDEEARLISEKLKVCETGLVPPGTEMDVDLTSFPDSKKIKKRKPKVEKVAPEPGEIVPDKARPRRSSSLRRSVERRKLNNLKDLERNSLERRRFLSRRSMERRRREHASPPHSRAPRRSRSRTRSPRRRSPLYRRSRSVERRSREERKRRKSRGRTFSPESDTSDRELWLLRRKARLRSRSREQSPQSKKNQSFLKELNKLSKPPEKKSFLKELQEKLGISAVPDSPVLHSLIQPPHHVQMAPSYPIAPVPPPAMPVQHPPFPRQEYDQQFFIGQQDMVPNTFQQPQGPPFGAPRAPPPGAFPPGQAGIFPQPGFHQQNVPPHLVPPPSPMNHIPPPMSQIPPPMMPVTPLPVPMPANKTPPTPAPPMSKKAIAKMKQLQSQQTLEGYKKLLEEKKITLSDFLSLTAKFKDKSKPIDIQNKIKVITRCQEALKEFIGEVKPTGHFVVRTSFAQSSEKPDVKYASPFKKVPLVRFQYTTHLKPIDEKQSVPSTLNRLLSNLRHEAIFEVPKPPPPIPPEAPTMRSVEKAPDAAHSALRSTKINVCQKFVQTDKYKCKDCEARASIRSYSVGSQTGVDLTFEVGCQVSPEDFQKSVKSILKNQSMAFLTPAQLLAAQTAVDKKSPASRELFSSAKKMSRPSELSPEAKKMRLGNSDGFAPSLTARSDRYEADFERTGGGYSGRFGAPVVNIDDRDRYVDADRKRYIDSERYRYVETEGNYGAQPSASFDRAPAQGYGGYTKELNFQSPSPAKISPRIAETGRPFFQPPEVPGSNPYGFPNVRRF